MARQSWKSDTTSELTYSKVIALFTTCKNVVTSGNNKEGTLLQTKARTELWCLTVLQIVTDLSKGESKVLKTEQLWAGGKRAGLAPSDVSE